MAATTFLTARWQYLAMVNYEIDPAILAPFVPEGTTLDLWHGKAFISLVGFMFHDTCVRNIFFPFHTNFEEVNLRFYVKDVHEGRGVVFIKEIVPRWGIAFLARILYHENYISLPMRHTIDQTVLQTHVEYEWKAHGKWQKIGVVCKGAPKHPAIQSEAEFITEHYWGYSKHRSGGSFEYNVDHPPWRIWEAEQCIVDVNMELLYGSAFAPFLRKPPASAFLAEGSEVKVFKGKKIVSF